MRARNLFFKSIGTSFEKPLATFSTTFSLAIARRPATIDLRRSLLFGSFVHELHTLAALIEALPLERSRGLCRLFEHRELHRDRTGGARRRYLFRLAGTVGRLPFRLSPRRLTAKLRLLELQEHHLLD